MVEVKRDELEEDVISKCIGQFGKWQASLVLMAALARFQSGWILLSITFLTPRTSFTCIKFNDNTTVIETEISKCYEDCVEYVYENEIHEESLTSEFGFICNDKWLASFNQSVLMLGVMFGSSLFGWISDRFGRRNGLLFAIVSNLMLSIGASYAPSIWWFIAIRFFIGLTSGGMLVITTIISIETIGPKYRHLASIIYTTESCAQITSVLFAYYTNTWREMLLATSVVSSVFLSYIFILPETPRWLITVGRTDEAIAMLTKAAKWNGLPTEQITKHVGAMHLSLTNNEDGDDKKNKLIFLLRNKILRNRMLIGYLLWFAVGLVYYGLSQYISFIGKNVYVNIASAGAMQVWIPLFAVFLNKYLGRRFILCCSFVACGLFLLILIFLTESQWVSIALAIVGLSCAKLSFATIYLFTSELFPTSVRNMGLGISNSGSKVGAMLAPFVANIQPVWVASLIFSVASLGVSVFCYMLPETKNINLQDAVDDD